MGRENAGIERTMPRGFIKSDRTSVPKSGFLAGYVAVFAALFAFITPPYEPPDEEHHLNYINYISRNLALPNQFIPAKTVIGEGHQYPLYYIVGAAVVRILDGDHRVDITPAVNRKHALSGGDSYKVPSFDHLSPKIFQDRSDLFTFYFLRAISVVFGIFNIIFLYRLAALFVADKKWRFFSGLWAASLPQALYVSASISNDALSNLLGTAALYYLAKIALEDGPSVSWKNHLGLGFVLGLGLLTKKSLLVLLLPAAVVLVRNVWKQMRTKSAGRQQNVLWPAVAVVAVILLLAGWFFIRNFWLYGDPFGTRMEKIVLAPLGFVAPKSLLSNYMLFHFPPRLAISFFGVFSMWALYLPLIFYVFFFLTVLIAAAGVFWVLKRRRFRDFRVYFTLGTALLMFGGVAYYNLTFTQPQGRWLFPALGAIAALVGIGWESVFSRIKCPQARKILYAICLAAFVLIDIVTLFRLGHFYHAPSQYGR
jgi:4-amino-4-deoxy-L-arabinose transferase-like glycosyltransferase